MKLSKITQEVVKTSITVKIDGGTDNLDFGYFPNGFTPKFEEEMQKHKDSELAGPLLVGMLIPLLAWVDIEDDNGKKIEITEDALQVVPINILNDIMTQINKDLSPEKEKSGESQGSFKA